MSQSVCDAPHSLLDNSTTTSCNSLLAEPIITSFNTNIHYRHLCFYFQTYWVVFTQGCHCIIYSQEQSKIENRLFEKFSKRKTNEGQENTTAYVKLMLHRRIKLCVKYAVTCAGSRSRELIYFVPTYSTYPPSLLGTNINDRMLEFYFPRIFFGIITNNALTMKSGL